MYYFNALGDLMSGVDAASSDPYLPKFFILLFLDTRMLSLSSLVLMVHRPSSTPLISECGTRNKIYAREAEDQSGAHPCLLLPFKDVHALGLPGLIKENTEYPIVFEFR